MQWTGPAPTRCRKESTYRPGELPAYTKREGNLRGVPVRFLCGRVYRRRLLAGAGEIGFERDRVSSCRGVGATFR